MKLSGNADKVIKLVLCNSLPSCSLILSKTNFENNTVTAKFVTHKTDSLLEFGANNVSVLENMISWKISQ